MFRWPQCAMPQRREFVNADFVHYFNLHPFDDDSMVLVCSTPLSYLHHTPLHCHHPLSLSLLYQPEMDCSIIEVA